MRPAGKVLNAVPDSLSFTCDSAFKNSSMNSYRERRLSPSTLPCRGVYTELQLKPRTIVRKMDRLIRSDDTLTIVNGG